MWNDGIQRPKVNVGFRARLGLAGMAAPVALAVQGRHGNS